MRHLVLSSDKTNKLLYDFSNFIIITSTLVLSEDIENVALFEEEFNLRYEACQTCVCI
jgi:hypothetical protein